MPPWARTCKKARALFHIPGGAIRGKVWPRTKIENNLSFGKLAFLSWRQQIAEVLFHKACLGILKLPLQSVAGRI